MADPVEFGLDRLLESGPLPAPAAMEMFAAVTAAIEREGRPVSREKLRAAHVTVGAEVGLAGDVWGDDGAETSLALGGLLYEMLAARAYAWDEDRERQIVDLHVRVGRQADLIVPFLADLLGAAPPMDLVALRTRAGAIRGRLGGVSMPNVSFDSAPPAAESYAEGPDSLTGTFSAGLLKSMAAQPKPTPPSSSSPPQPVHRKDTDDLGQLLEKFESSTPPPYATPVSARTPAPQGPPLALWGVVIVLLLLAIVFLIVLVI